MYCGVRARLEARDAFGGAGQAKVGDLGTAAAVEHHVGGLQIAMQHAFVVRRLQSRA
jgi:hypothetical protein